MLVNDLCRQKMENCFNTIFALNNGCGVLPRSVEKFTDLQRSHSHISVLQEVLHQCIGYDREYFLQRQPVAKSLWNKHPATP